MKQAAERIGRNQRRRVDEVFGSATGARRRTGAAERPCSVDEAREAWESNPRASLHVSEDGEPWVWVNSDLSYALTTEPAIPAPAAAAVPSETLSGWTIWLDGTAYSGIDYAGAETAGPPPANGPAFRAIGHETRDALRFGGEPFVVEGRTNLRSHLERLLTRMADGTLNAREIIIRAQ